jgi:Tol biopolymer transport system component
MISRPTVRLLAVAATAAVLAVQGGPAWALTILDAFPTVGTVKALSVTPTGVVGAAGPDVPFRLGGVSVSSNGRFTAFASTQPNLVPGDANQVADVFRRDVVNGKTQLVSLTDAGARPTKASGGPSISGSGTRVAFITAAALVPADTNILDDVYVRDLVTKRSILVSATPAGAAGDNGGGSPSISADGRFVAFVSDSTNLVSPGVTDGNEHLWLRDLQTGSTRQADVPNPGVPPDLGSSLVLSAVVSATGRYVAFSSTNNGLVAGDRHGEDIFRFDAVTGLVTLAAPHDVLSLSQLAGGISADGRYIAFSSDSDRLTTDDTTTELDCFVRDQQTGATTLISRLPNGGRRGLASGCGGISDNGLWVLVDTRVAGMAPGDTDIFLDYLLVNRVSRARLRASQTSTGAALGADAGVAGISRNGALVSFGTTAGTVTPGDGNAVTDVFEIRLR